jgi:hypothetical protein
MQEWMANTPEAERKAQTDKMMQDWQTWMDTHKANIVDNGNPLGKTKRVTTSGVADTKNDLNYYIIVQADSHDAAAQMVKDNPHLMIPDSYVDVMEISHMGM